MYISFVLCLLEQLFHVQCTVTSADSVCHLLKLTNPATWLN